MSRKDDNKSLLGEIKEERKMKKYGRFLLFALILCVGFYYVHKSSKIYL